jgi:alkylation response protein AidB-like acyl-CoA dehydrogenase
VDASTTVTKARGVAAAVLAPVAAENDKTASFSTKAVDALGTAGLLGLLVPGEFGGSALGPRALSDVTAALAEADASVAMVFLMHCAASAAIAAAPRTTRLEQVLREIGAGRHLTTLAFSEAGSRSHFWAPVSRAERLDGAGVRLTARKSWVTSAGYAQSYVTSSLAPDAATATDSSLYVVPADTPGLSVAAPWDGMGLRANASAPMVFDGCTVPPDLRITEDGGGFNTMLGVVLPLFNVGSAAVALGICRATVASTIQHLKTARFEHLGVTLGEGLPTLRAHLANMQVQTDSLAAHLGDTIAQIERQADTTMLRVLEAKVVAGETAIAVTSTAMRVCGGAAFSRHTSIDRYFRDAHAGAVMAPTADVLREFIGKSLLGLPLF